MSVAQVMQPEPTSDPGDQRIVLHGVSWAQLVAFLEMRGESSGVRITYLEGELELMSPSWNHEGIKKCLARLFEAWADAHDLALNGFGSWTLKKRARARAVEPDECYSLGPRKAVPDVAIEVTWTHGSVDKLEVYRGLRVPEIWMWEEGRVDVYALRKKGYERIARSELVPALDLAELASFIDGEDQSGAVRRYRAALLAKG
ncbi:MAG: hypothetical protein JWM10_1335 [Myxococcaceae bacterium]|nr:hypothetical protein [Myxococcaceae bacterium]